MGNIITFYSFKGGVGRTMALANIAVALARRGLRVLAVDWDLEAPGLDRYFRQFEADSSDSHKGLLDLLIDASESSASGNSPNWRQYTSELYVGGKHPLTLLRSGLADEEYAGRVLKFDWHTFFQHCKGGTFIESLRDQWRDAFDVTLIDSRTGITDSGGVCTIQLPDVLVLVFTANEQSLLGARDIALRAQQARQKLLYDRMPLLVIPLPARFDGRVEFEESQQWLQIFAAQLALFYKDWIPYPHTPIQILERMKLPYVAYFSYGEKLPVVSHSTSDPESLGYAYEVSATLIAEEFRVERLLNSSFTDLGRPIQGAKRWISNIHRLLPLTVILLLACLVFLWIESRTPAEISVSENAGFVLDIFGEWILNEDSNSLLSIGQPLPISGTIRAKSPEARDNYLTIAWLDGSAKIYRCSIEAACYEPIKISKSAPIETEANFVKAISRLFSHKPYQYTSAISR